MHGNLIPRMERHTISFMDLGRMMHEVLRLFKKRSELQPYEDIRISTEQISILHALSRTEEEVIQKDIAETMGKDKSAILRQIGCLEEKGLVRRVAALEDRRKNYVMVTKLGQRVIDHYLGLVYQIMEELQEGLTPEELEVFTKVVTTIRMNAAKK